MTGRFASRCWPLSLMPVCLLGEVLTSNGLWLAAGIPVTWVIWAGWLWWCHPSRKRSPDVYAHERAAREVAGMEPDHPELLTAKLRTEDERLLAAIAEREWPHKEYLAIVHAYRCGQRRDGGQR